jgi:hypothetical protein
MADPVSLTAGAIASLAFQKFVESGAGELAKKFTTDAIAKMGLLWERVKAKLQGKSAKLDEALVKVEQGDLAALDTITKHLDVAMDEHPDFAEELKILARDITAGKLQDNSSMVMEVSGSHATGYQSKNEVVVQGGESYTGNITIHKNYTVSASD